MEHGGLRSCRGDFFEVEVDVNRSGLSVDGKKIVEGICTRYRARGGLDDYLAQKDRGSRISEREDRELDGSLGGYKLEFVFNVVLQSGVEDDRKRLSLDLEIWKSNSWFDPNGDLSMDVSCIFFAIHTTCWYITRRDHNYGRFRRPKSLEVYEVMVRGMRDKIDAYIGVKGLHGRPDMDYPIHVNFGETGAVAAKALANLL